MKIEVGMPLDARRMPRPEGVHFQTERGGHILYAFFDSPGDDEIVSFRHGPVDLAIYVEQPVIVFLARIGDLPWVDAPFTWHLVPAEHRAVPDRDLLTILLADARDTTVYAIRVVSMPPAVALALRDAIAVQAAAEWDSRGYDRCMSAIVTKHSSEQLAGLAQAKGRAGV